MNILKMTLLSSKLLIERIIEKNGKEYTISEMIPDPLPVLKEINPTKEELDSFLNNRVDIQNSGRRYDWIII